MSIKSLPVSARVGAAPELLLAPSMLGIQVGCVEARVQPQSGQVYTLGQSPQKIIFSFDGNQVADLKGCLLTFDLTNTSGAPAAPQSYIGCIFNQLTVRCGSQVAEQRISYNLYECQKYNWAKNPTWISTTGTLVSGMGSLASRTVANGATRSYSVYLEDGLFDKVLPLLRMPEIQVELQTEVSSAFSTFNPVIAGTPSWSMSNVYLHYNQLFPGKGWMDNLDALIESNSLNFNYVTYSNFYQQNSVSNVSFQLNETSSAVKQFITVFRLLSNITSPTDNSLSLNAGGAQFTAGSIANAKINTVLYPADSFQTIPDVYDEVVKFWGFKPSCDPINYATAFTSSAAGSFSLAITMDAHSQFSYRNPSISSGLDLSRSNGSFILQINFAGGAPGGATTQQDVFIIEERTLSISGSRSAVILQ